MGSANQSSARSSSNEAAHEERHRGLEALRKGDYSRALASLEAARELSPDGEEVDDALVEVLKRLEAADRLAEEKGPAEEEASVEEKPLAEEEDPERTAAASRASVARDPREAQVYLKEERREPRRETRRRPERSSKSARPRVAEVREKQRVRESSREDLRATPKLGVLLVTSEPPGLVVRIDDRIRDLTPTRIQVPIGEHRVQLFRGRKEVFSQSVEVSDREPALVSEVFDSAALELEPSAPGRIDGDGKLDLVNLIEKSPVDGTRASPDLDRAGRLNPPGPSERGKPEGGKDETSPRVEPVSPGDGPGWGAPNAGPARLVVFRPGSDKGDIESALSRSLSGARVRVAQSASDLRHSPTADAVIAPPRVLRELGLEPSLLSLSQPEYRLVSFSPIDPGAPPQRVAIFAEGQKRQTPAQVTTMLGLAQTPKLRWVRKVEDLLSSLQLSMADAALVNVQHLDTLERRTTRRLYKRAFSQSGQSLAVAFIPGGRRDQVEPPLRQLSPEAKDALGVFGWR